MVWVTCCALHNMLLDVDGLSMGWDHGVPSYWQAGENGQFEVSDLPRAVRTLFKPADSALFVELDKSKFRYCSQQQEERLESTNKDYNEQREEELVLSAGVEERSISVSGISLKGFRSLLVENFDIIFNQKRIIWPTRLPSKPNSGSSLLNAGAFTWLSVRTYCGTGHCVTVLVFLSMDVLWY
jgi:hypothetical protein